MGLSMEFYAGDAESIGRAFSEIEWDDLRNEPATAAYADLSLRLSPDDLDTLSEVAAGLAGVTCSLLSECLIRHVGVIDDGQTGGADLVDPKWPEMIAALDEEDAEPLTARWFHRLGDTYGEPLEVNRQAVVAIRALIRLCKKSVAGSHDVVHVWYL
jgi:hypothetical protein